MADRREHVRMREQEYRTAAEWYVLDTEYDLADAKAWNRPEGWYQYWNKPIKHRAYIALRGQCAKRAHTHVHPHPLPEHPCGANNPPSPHGDDVFELFGISPFT